MLKILSFCVFSKSMCVCMCVCASATLVPKGFSRAPKCHGKKKKEILVFLVAGFQMC